MIQWMNAGTPPWCARLGQDNLNWHPEIVKAATVMDWLPDHGWLPDWLPDPWLASTAAVCWAAGIQLLAR
jgi:hypothetical protein